MSAAFVDCSAFQAKLQETANEVVREHIPTVSEKELEERLRAGDRQIMDELPELLQPRLLQRAYQYIRDFRHVVPAYLEAFDLVQEASMVILKRLEEARAKESPLGYLIAAGYQTMRQLCLSFVQEPYILSLNRPYFKDDETPLHECLPITLLQNSPYEGEDIGKYEALYQAIEQLPELQRIAIEHTYGLGEHAASRGCEMQRDLGWSATRIRYHKHKGLVSLVLALRHAYSYDTKKALLACIPKEQRKRMDQAYARLQVQYRDQQIPLNKLVREAKVESWAARAYLQATGKPRFSRKEQAWQRLDRAYAALQARGAAVTGQALQRETGARWEIVSAYLDERIGPQWKNAYFEDIARRLSESYADMLTKGEHITVSALSRAASVSHETARAYLRRLAQQG